MYRVCTQSNEPREFDVRTVEYQSKCESRRYFSQCAGNPRYTFATWEKGEPGNWERLATLIVNAPAQEAAPNG